MIKELTQDLINKIATVTSLTGKVGAVVGGTATDPTMAEAPVPFCWVTFGGDHPINDTEVGKLYQQVAYNFAVIAVIQYGQLEADFLNDSLKILEDIPAAVRGTEAYKYADLWEYSGSELKSILPDRLIYQFNFTIVGHHKI